ncbi:MAG: glycosyltransferase [Candidatus Muiribacteriota bacterium]
MKKISVSILGTLPPLKAISSYCAELVSELDKKALITFYSFSSIYPSFLHPSKDSNDDGSFPYMNFKNTKIKRYITWYNPLSWLRAGLTNKSDIFHVQWWSLPIFPIVFVMVFLAKLKKIPVVITVHNVSPHEKSNLFILAGKIIFYFCDSFIVHSENNKKTLSKIYNIKTKNINVIPHGPLDVFKGRDYNEQKEKKYFKQKYNISETEKVILFFGAIRDYKNLELILNSLSYVLEKLNVKLVIAGSLWESFDKYEEIIKKFNLTDNVVKVLEYIPTNEVSKFFAASDLVLIPYKNFSSQSGVGAAALSFEKPVIVSDKGGLGDLVKDEFCILKDNSDQVLAEKIVKILSDDLFYKKLKTDSKNINDAFSWAKISEKTFGLYAKLLKSRHSNEDI